MPEISFEPACEAASMMLPSFCELAGGQGDAVARFVTVDCRWLIFAIDAHRLQAVAAGFDFRPSSGGGLERADHCVGFVCVVLLSADCGFALRDNGDRQDRGVGLGLNDRVAADSDPRLSFILCCGLCVQDSRGCEHEHHWQS